jgi:DNA-binding response OmpR family regulator
MTAIYAFGQYRLDVAAGILFLGAEPVALGQRAVALLQILVEGAGNPISKDRLIESAWPGLAVEESNLAVQIAALGGSLQRSPAVTAGLRHCRAAATATSGRSSSRSRRTRMLRAMSKPPLSRPTSHRWR